MQNETSLLSAQQFRKRFLWLIALTWLVPPFFGMGFLIQIDFFSLSEIATILSHPLEPIFAGGFFLVSLMYFRRYALPIQTYLDNKTNLHGERALRCMQRFPLHYWGLFIFYLLLAPTSMIASGYLYLPNFSAGPADWFRIHLVALIVSVIVGLPIFFFILNLFGQCVRDLNFPKPHVTITTKVFLIGALTPLLIDTMLVQYYWARTGFFTAETFVIWLLLEVVAIAGSLMFMRNFGQSLHPLHNLVTSPYSFSALRIDNLKPLSTDELGVLAQGYYSLLNDLRIYTNVLDLNNRILSGEKNSEENLAEVIDASLRLGLNALQGQNAFLLLCDQNCTHLLHVASPGKRYRSEGFYQIPIDEVSVLSEIFRAGQTVSLNDLADKFPAAQRQIGEASLSSLVAAPLISEGRNIGLVLISFTEPTRKFNQRDLSVIRQLARQITLSLQTYNLRLMSSQAEQRRREREDQVRLLLNSAAEALIFIDMEGKCQFVNPACLRLLGYEHEEELLGQKLDSLLYRTPEQQGSLSTAKIILNTIKRGESYYSADVLHWRANNTTFPVELWVHPVNRDGELYGAVMTFFDITLRKQNEAELQSYREQLEQRVAERTEALMLAKEREQQANLAKTEFLSRMSHELRTPLNSILGFAQLLLSDQGLNDTQHEQIDEICKSSQHLLQVISEILDLSRIEAGKLELELQPLEINELVRQTLQTILPLAQQREVKVEIEELSVPLYVMADAERLREVVLDLLSNAIKYIGQGKQVTLKLSCPEASRLRISVMDDGPGIAEDKLDKIFEPFTHAINSDHRAAGTGIGLSMTKRWVEAMAGRISIESHPGQGCRFDLDFAVVEPSSQNP